MIINSYGLNLSNTVSIGGIREKLNNNQVNNFNLKKFDSLNLSQLFKQYSDTDNSKKAEIKKMLLEISEEDKLSDFEKVRRSYANMQRVIRTEISSAKNDLEVYNEFSEEKQYYQSLLDESDGDNITVTNGKYLLEHLDNGTAVSRNDIKSCIAYVERRIQNELIDKKTYYAVSSFVDTPSEEELFDWLERRRSEIIIPSDDSDRLINEKGTEQMNNWRRNEYNYFANEFSKATGIESDYFNLGEDNPMFSKAGYTIENFAEKTNERISLLTECSEALKKIMSDYMKKEQAVEAYAPQRDITAKLTIYLREQKLTSELLDEFTDSFNSVEKN